MVSRSGYRFFLREQLDQMTNRKNYRSIISEMWKKVKEDPARLISYNNRARQMRDDTSATKKRWKREKQKIKKLTHHMISCDEFFNETLTEIKDDTQKTDTMSHPF